jgi:hypothetical protein
LQRSNEEKNVQQPLLQLRMKISLLQLRMQILLQQLLLLMLHLLLQAQSGVAAGRASERQHHLHVQGVQLMILCMPAQSSHALASASPRPSGSSRHSNMQM